MKNRLMFKEYIAGLSDLFDKQLSKVAVEMYWKALEIYSDKQCKIAFDIAVTDCKFFPKPAELIQFIKSGSGDIEDIALIEADKVVNAIRHTGYYTSVTFDDPVTMAVIEQGWGGWIKICDLRDEEIKWFRKDFTRIYKAYSNQGVKRYGHLVGFHEDSNNERGFLEHIPEPVLIGDIDRAQKVLDYNKTILLDG
jgi:hypothetical protein